MDLDSLTQAMYDFVESKGWLADDTSKPQTPRNLAVSLVLEASEVLEHFQWGDEPDRPDELADELADVMLYLLQLASFSDIDLGEAVIAKLQKNYSRHWPAESTRVVWSTGSNCQSTDIDRASITLFPP